MRYPRFLSEWPDCPRIQLSLHGEVVSFKVTQIPHTQGKHVQNMIPHVYFHEFRVNFSRCLLSLANWK